MTLRQRIVELQEQLAMLQAERDQWRREALQQTEWRTTTQIYWQQKCEAYERQLTLLTGVKP